jgi:hypothetical protein
VHRPFGISRGGNPANKEIGADRGGKPFGFIAPVGAYGDRPVVGTRAPAVGVAAQSGGRPEAGPVCPDPADFVPDL